MAARVLLALAVRLDTTVARQASGSEQAVATAQ
jgi:hypothetical protein